MRRLFALAIIAGAVALAVIIGQRMSTDAMAVAIGVVFGVAASIPTSLLVVAATRGRRDEPASRQPDLVQRHGHSQPQIIIMPGMMAGGSGRGQQAPWLAAGQQQEYPLPPNGQGGYDAVMPERRFRVVGEEDHWLEAAPFE